MQRKESFVSILSLSVSIYLTYNDPAEFERNIIIRVAKYSLYGTNGISNE